MSAVLASSPRPAAAPLPTSRAPYTSQQEWIDDQLVAMRRRVAIASDHVDALAQDLHAPAHWPAELLAYEACLEDRQRASTVTLPLAQLRDRFGLSATELRVLWFLLACELCPHVRMTARALSTEHVPDPTSDLLRRVVYGPRCGVDVWRELGPAGPLRRFGFIERTDDGEHTAEHRQTWKAGARVLSLAHGDLSLDPAVAELAALALPARTLDELELAGEARAELSAAFDDGDLVLVHGRAGSGRRASLVATAHARGLEVLVVEARALAKERDAARRQLRAIARECLLLGLTPLVRELDVLAPSGELPDRLELVEQELRGLVLATSTRPLARRWTRAFRAIELAPLAGAQRATLWQRAIPAAGPGDAELLATLYPIAPALIDAAGALAVRRAADTPMTPAHIEDALRTVLDDRLAGLARRVTITQDWDDLVLPEEQTTAIAELIARVRERIRVYETWGFARKLGKGLGVTALFSGPPGTGKTLAAGLIARALRLELYQVDASKLVSKWIGETEKNLAALFDAAEAGHAVLLFDEADALFGKRTDVKSSNDRHANQETNFLLQRLESFAGICILTTNHDSAIDEAFRRRLSSHIRLPMPDRDERALLWRAMLPAEAPCEEPLDLRALASKYVMSGGYIRNAVLRAAFLAADEGGAIDTARLVRAAQLEYEALGKVIGAGS